MLITSRPTWQEHTGWSRRLGLPRLQVLAGPYLVPSWPESLALLQEFPSATADVPHTVDVSRVWTRWTPGIPGSQMDGEHCFHAPPLWDTPPKVFRGKGAEPLWHQQCREIRAFLSNLASTGLDGSEAFGWAVSQGGIDKNGIQALMRGILAATKRVVLLRNHNQAAHQQGWHVAAWWDTNQRPLCLLCKSRGYMTGQLGFLRTHCKMNTNPGTQIAEQEQALQKHSALLCQRMQILKRMYAQA